MGEFAYAGGRNDFRIPPPVERREDKRRYPRRYVLAVVDPTVFTGVVWTKKIIHCIVPHLLHGKEQI